MDIRKFWVDIEDGSGNRYGDGPLRARVFRVKKPLSESGDFAFDILGSDPNIGALQIKRVAICRYIDANGSTQTLGGGIIDKIVAQLDPSGLLVYQVSGNDLTRELFYRSVGSLKLESAGVGVTNGPDLIMAYAPAGWTINSGSTSSPVYLGFAGESVLAALIKCAENAGEHWRLGSGREIDWIGLPASFVSSGVRAVQHLNDAISAESLASLAVVMAMSETHDSAEVLSRVIPIGAGIGGAATTLANATDPAPSGYTLDTVNNYLKQNAAEAAYGRIEKSIEFKNLGPLGSTVTDAASASNALLQAAYQHLERFKAPAKFYDVSIWTNAVLEPGQTIQIIYRKLIDSAVVFDLNDEFIILSVEQTIDEQGLSTTKMMVATIDRKPATDADVMLDELQQSNNLQTNRQQILANDIVGLSVLIGSGTPGHVAQWDSTGGVLEDSTLIKSGAGLLTLAAAGDYTLTIPDTGTAAIGAGTLSVSSTNSTATPTHTHAITSSNSPGVAARLLATNASGGFTLGGAITIGDVAVPLEMYRSAGTPTARLTAYLTSTTNGGRLSLRGAGGTQASPSDVLNNYILGEVQFGGQVDGAMRTMGTIRTSAIDTLSSTSYPANMYFLLTLQGATTLSTLMTLHNGGNVGVNTGTGAPLGHLGIVNSDDRIGLSIKVTNSQAANGLEIINASNQVQSFFGPTGGAVFNEGGTATGDLRAESDTEANMLWLDASADALFLGGSTNGIQIDKGGRLTFIGTATYWKDVAPYSVATGSGPSAPALAQYGTTGHYLHKFADNHGSDEAITIAFQMPHEWKIGSDVHFHVHVIPSANGSAGNNQVIFRASYQWVNIDGSFSTTTNTDLDTTFTVGASDGNAHKLWEPSALSGSGKTLSGGLVITLSRLSKTNPGGADNYTGDVWLLFTDCHVECDAVGSADETTK